MRYSTSTSRRLRYRPDLKTYLNTRTVTNLMPDVEDMRSSEQSCHLLRLEALWAWDQTNGLGQDQWVMGIEHHVAMAATEVHLEPTGTYNDR